MRDKDNFINAYDYIKNQLFPYDYNNPEHVHILKLKLWALDAEPLQEEIDAGFKDEDFYNPKNHKQVLANELDLLEIYRKTEDGLYERHQITFPKVMKMREKTFQNWIKFKDPITKEYRKDYEMPYMSRPSTMTEDQFRELYLLYKEKEKDGQLENCYEITSKITTDDIDVEKWGQEYSIINYRPPEELKKDMDLQALNVKKTKDDDIVKEMRTVFDKIASMLVAAAPEVYIPPEEPPIISTSSSTDLEGFTETITTTITVEYVDCVCLALNCPTNRVYVELIRNDPSHKGYIQEYPEANIHEGGYRFKGRLSDIVTEYEMPTVYEGFPSNWTVTVSPYKIGTVEWDWESFIFADKYTKITTTTVSGGDNAGSTQEIEVFVTPPHNPVGTPKSDNALISFEEYKKIWYNFNQIRENRMREVGLRDQVEALIDNDPEDTLEDLLNYFEVLKKEKIDVEQLLVERCLFGEWIY